MTRDQLIAIRAVPDLDLTQRLANAFARHDHAKGCENQDAVDRARRELEVAQELVARSTEKGSEGWKHCVDYGFSARLQGSDRFPGIIEICPLRGLEPSPAVDEITPGAYGPPSQLTTALRDLTERIRDIETANATGIEVILREIRSLRAELREVSK